MKYQEAVDWIHSRLSFGSRPGLIRVEALLEKLDNPHNKIKSIHIGGTNGKGSTVTDLRCLLEEEGLKVGSFTSPFINYFNERITINDVPISNEDLVRWVEIIQPLVAELDDDSALTGITQFEIITALMFGYFWEQDVDVAIVEVGLGGLYDSTNVVDPLISGITTIGLDHMDILGETIEEIAGQKAGIIKMNRPVVTGNLSATALEVIREKARQTNSVITSFQNDYQMMRTEGSDLTSEVFDFKNKWLALKQVEVSLIGSHQVENAGMAIEIYCQLASQLAYDISEEHIREGLKKAHWSGRFEIMSQDPYVILDGAHNQPAIDVLVANCRELFPDKKMTIIFGALKTKDVSQMIKGLHTLPHSTVYLTPFLYPKALKLTDYQALKLTTDTLYFDNWQEGLDKLRGEAAEDEVILVTGSLYFISQVREYILGGK